LPTQREDDLAALCELNQAIETQPASRNLCYNRGVLQHRLGDWPGALRDFSEAVILAYQVGDSDLIDAAEHHFIELFEQMRGE